MDLSGSELFRGAPGETLEFARAHAERISLASGEVLLSPERHNEHIYILQSGTLSLRFGSPESVEIRVLRPGVSVGEMSIVDGEPPSAYVVAREACQLVRLHREVVMGIITENPVACNLLRILSGWMKSNTAYILNDRLTIDELRGAAQHDALTGLYNRRWLDERMRRLRGDEMPLTVLLIDLDHFKSYNDLHGHQGGDSALVAVGEVLRKVARQGDAPCRYGGEEFLVLLERTPLEGGVVMAERIRNAMLVREVRNARGESLPGVTLSVGIATAGDRETLSGVIGAADAQLYRAKRGGRNRICF